MLPFCRFQRQRCIKILCPKDPDFYTPLALKTAKGQHLPALEVYKSQSPIRTIREVSFLQRLHLQCADQKTKLREVGDFLGVFDFLRSACSFGIPIEDPLIGISTGCYRIRKPLKTGNTKKKTRKKYENPPIPGWALKIRKKYRKITIFRAQPGMGDFCIFFSCFFRISSFEGFSHSVAPRGDPFPLNLIKSPAFTNTPCKSTCFYNAPSILTAMVAF